LPYKDIKKDRRTPFSGFSVLAPESYTRLARIVSLPISRLSPLVAVIVILQLSPELRLVRVLLPERFIALCYLLLRRRLYALSPHNHPPKIHLGTI